MQLSSMDCRTKILLTCAGVLLCALGATIVGCSNGAADYVYRHYQVDNTLTRKLRQLHADTSVRIYEQPIDWAARYPFATEAAPQTSPYAQARALYHDLQATKQKTEQWLNKHILGYDTLLELANRYKATLRWNIEPLHGRNSVVTLPDGQLISFRARCDTTELAAQTAELADFCQARGIPFLMVLAPGKISRNETYAGTLDFSNENGDEYTAGLRARHVPYLDLRDALEAEGLDQHSMFYRTDHHWTATAGLWASSKIAAWLNTYSGYDIDLTQLSPSAYTKERLPHYYLGSYGEPLTTARVQPDDFVIYRPKAPVRLHITVPTMRIDQHGDFDITYNWDVIRPNHPTTATQSAYSTGAYGGYSYGRRALSRLHNETRHDGHRLLMLCDSYANVVRPFLALGTETITSIDPRQFTGSIHRYIEDEQPDAIVLLYYIGELSDHFDDKTPHTASFDFH